MIKIIVVEELRDPDDINEDEETALCGKFLEQHQIVWFIGTTDISIPINNACLENKNVRKDVNV